MRISPKFKEIIADELNIELSIIVPQARFIEELGADSLDCVELVMRIEEEFNIAIPDEDAEKLLTVGEAFQYIQQNIDPPIEEVEKELVESGSFDSLTSYKDSRERTLSSIVRRRGQQEFRKRLLRAYDQKCAITGYAAVEALEAAHIMPYRGEDFNHITNGLLLRADIHTLFDLYLICVDTRGETMTILLSPELQQTAYLHLDGKPLRLPVDKESLPNQEALGWHRKECKKHKHY